MTATLSHSSPARFQLADANTWPKPWPLYRALRDHDPVQHVVPQDKPDHDYYVLSRHADIWAAARDHETFSSALGLTVNYGELELIDAETGDVLKVGFDDESRKEYTSNFDRYAEEVRRLAQRNGGRYAAIPTGTSLDDAVFGLMIRAQGVV